MANRTDQFRRITPRHSPSIEGGGPESRLNTIATDRALVEVAVISPSPIGQLVPEEPQDTDKAQDGRHQHDERVFYDQPERMASLFHGLLDHTVRIGSKILVLGNTPSVKDAVVNITLIREGGHGFTNE